MVKQNKIKLYAEALVEILLKKGAEGPERSRRTVENFAKLLIKEGLQKKSKEILELAEEMILVKKGNKKIIFETARKITAPQKKILEGIAKSGDLIKEKINPELIAGVKIIINNSRQFDASMKNKLQKIF